MLATDVRDTLREIMTKRGCNQATIARRANLTPNKLSATLNKNRKLDANEMFAICAVLELDPGMLKPEAATY